MPQSTDLISSIQDQFIDIIDSNHNYDFIVNRAVSSADNLIKLCKGKINYKGENKNFEDVESSMFIRLSVKDEPGVLAKIAGTFGENNVSIESVIQEGRGDKAELVLVTHEAPEKDLSNSINQISSLDAVTTVTSLLRVYV